MTGPGSISEKPGGGRMGMQDKSPGRQERENQDREHAMQNDMHREQAAKEHDKPDPGPSPKP